MSERGKRNVEAAKIDARLRDVQEAKRRILAEEEALTIAAKALAEEPRKLLTTKITLHHLPVPTDLQQGDCSECGVAVGVYPQKFFRFCPNCGSKVEEAIRETLQGAEQRLTRLAVQDAMGTAFSN